MTGPVSVDIAWLDEMQGPSLGWSLVTLKSPAVQPRSTRSFHNARNTCGSGGEPSAMVTTGSSSSVLISASRRAPPDQSVVSLSAEEVKLIPVHDAKPAVAVVPGRMRIARTPTPAARRCPSGEGRSERSAPGRCIAMIATSGCVGSTRMSVCASASTIRLFACLTSSRTRSIQAGSASVSMRERLRHDPRLERDVDFAIDPRQFRREEHVADAFPGEAERLRKGAHDDEVPVARHEMDRRRRDRRGNRQTPRRRGAPFPCGRRSRRGAPPRPGRRRGRAGCSGCRYTTRTMRRFRAPFRARSWAATRRARVNGNGR